MFARAVLASILLALLTTACTTGDEAGTAAEHTQQRGGDATSSPENGEPEGSGGEPTRSDDGPLYVEGGGSLCIDNRINTQRDFTYGEDLLKTSAPVELEAVELVNSQGIRVLNSWTFPSRGIPYGGSWSGWPLPKRATTHDRLDWDERTRAQGARLDPGTPYNFLVRMRRDPGDARQGFDALRIEYHTAEKSYVMKTTTTVWFRRKC
jgi:hypothetical protein